MRSWPGRGSGPGATRRRARPAASCPRRPAARRRACGTHPCPAVASRPRAPRARAGDRGSGSARACSSACSGPATGKNGSRRGEYANLWGAGSAPVASCLTGERGLVPKLVWRVKLVAELEPGVTTETEVARLERDEEASLADLGLRLDEAKRLTAALQAEVVAAQVATGIGRAHV